MKKNLFHKGVFLLTTLINSTTVCTVIEESPWQYFDEEEDCRELPIKSFASLPVDISFFIADIKYEKNKLKILEFGQGPRSRFKGHDTLYGKGTIWSNFWTYLKQFNLPIWYVGPNLDQKSVKEEMAFNTLRALPNTYAVNSIKELKEHEAFKTHLKKKAPQDPYAISDYQGIAIFRHKNASSTELKKFKSSFPAMIVVDQASSPYVNNKYLTSLLFNDEQHIHFRPQGKTYEKVYYPTLAQKIINDFNCDVYVIKPLDGFKGDGVIMVRKNNLNIVLYNILNKTQAIKESKNPTYNHWAKDKNKKFIVEEYEASKLIHVDGLTYDPTMRIVFCLHYNQGKIGLNYLGGYWKLPPKGLEEEGTLIEKSKSKINPNRAITSAQISDEDRQHVEEILNQLLPHLYQKMLNEVPSKRVSTSMTQPAQSLA